MNEPDSAERTETLFYAAFRDGDLESMAVIWDQSDDIVCVHPQGPRLLGYERVIRSWEQILSDTEGFHIEVELLSHFTDDELSVRFVNETVFNEQTGADPVTLLATNAYRKTDSGWRIVLHHASPVPARRRQEQRATAKEPDVTLH